MAMLQFLFFLTCISAQVYGEVFTSTQLTEIDRFITRVMECNDVPGLTAAVVKGGEIWTKGYGVADRENNISVTPDTLFAIGSVSKGFTTVLLSMLLNDTNGRFTWKSKVKDILGPDFAFTDEERTREMTLEDLVIHRTGLSTASLTLYSGYDRTFTRAEMAKRFRFLPAVKSFRDVFEYNNWPYILAGHVIEVLSREPYEDTMDKRIFQPLGMTSTRWIGYTVQANDDGVAKPYYAFGDELVETNSTTYDIYPNEPAGSIASTASDMAKWLHFLLRKGETSQNKSLISPTDLMECFQKRIIMPPGLVNRPTYPVSDIFDGYGYGWSIANYRGYKRIWHNGALHPYLSMALFYPDLDFGIYTNINGPGTKDPQFQITLYLTDILMGEEPWLNPTTGCSFPSPWVNTTAPTLPVNNLSNDPVECVSCYVGIYGHQLYGNLEVKVIPETGLLMLQYRRLSGSLHPTELKTTFKFDFWEPFDIFTHVGNYTGYPLVQFNQFIDGKYENVSIIGQSMTFYRGVNFDDAIKTGKKTDNPKGAVCGQDNVGADKMLLFCIVFAVIVQFLFRLQNL